MTEYTINTLVFLLTVLTVFKRHFTGKGFNRHKKYGHIRLLRLKVNIQQYFILCFTQIFILTVISDILVSHIELKNSTESADLQPHTMP